MKLTILSPALKEAGEAAEYYETQQSGLGHAFYQEVECYFGLIMANPEAYAERPVGYRRVNFQQKFRHHYIAYVLEGREIIIAAIAHASREPEYWRDRI